MNYNDRRVSIATCAMLRTTDLLKQRAENYRKAFTLACDLSDEEIGSMDIVTATDMVVKRIVKTPRKNMGEDYERQ